MKLHILIIGDFADGASPGKSRNSSTSNPGHSRILVQRGDRGAG